MKTLSAALFLFILHSSIFSQGWVPADVQNALSRIEQAIRSAHPENIEDMIQSGITIRLEDSLYQSVSSIQAVDVLKEYFSDKEVRTFNFQTPGQGTMIYTSNGKQDTMHVDIWLRRHMTGPTISAINISNYPLATVFFDIPREKRK